MNDECELPETSTSPCRKARLNWRAAGIAEHVIEELFTSQHLENVPHHVTRGLRPADRHRRPSAGLLDVVQRLETVLPAVDDTVLDGGDADGVHLVEVEPCPFVADDLPVPHAPTDLLHHRAVARRLAVEIVRCQKASRTRHVLHDQRRIPGNMFLDVARDQPRVGVITASRRRGNDHPELFPLVEIVCRPCRSRSDHE